MKHIKTNGFISHLSFFFGSFTAIGTLTTNTNKILY